MFAVCQLGFASVDFEKAFRMSLRTDSPRFRVAFAWVVIAAAGWAFVTVVQPGAARAQAKPDDVGAVLERMRQAAGQATAGQAAELLIDGTADRSGSTFEYSVRFSPSGMFLQTLAGPLPEQGRVQWQGGLVG